MMFRGEPKYPMFKVLPASDISPEFTLVRAFYMDLSNINWENHPNHDTLQFHRFEDAVNLFVHDTDFDRHSAEIWWWIPHPRALGERSDTATGAPHPYGMSWPEWRKFYKKWNRFVAPDLPNELRPD
jgi:hypothetical protein